MRHFAVVFLLVAISSMLVIAIMSQPVWMILPVIGAVAVFVFTLGVETAEKTGPDIWPIDSDWRRW